MIGIAILIGSVVAVGLVVMLLRGGSGGPSFPPGTRAFESEMSLRIISGMTAARERELAGADDAQRELLTRQLANLRKQEALHRAILDAHDVSPGKMSIGVNPDSDRID